MVVECELSQPNPNQIPANAQLGFNSLGKASEAIPHPPNHTKTTQTHFEHPKYISSEWTLLQARVNY